MQNESPLHLLFKIMYYYTSDKYLGSIKNFVCRISYKTNKQDLKRQLKATDNNRPNKPALQHVIVSAFFAFKHIPKSLISLCMLLYNWIHHDVLVSHLQSNCVNKGINIYPQGSIDHSSKELPAHMALQNTV